MPGSRILADRAHLPEAQAWRLLHVVAAPIPTLSIAKSPDCWRTTLRPPRRLDAYEATSDLGYFRFAHAIGNAMITRFFDPLSGGFFDAEPSPGRKKSGCPLDAPQTVAGFAYPGGKSDGRNRAAAFAPIHRRRSLSR